MKTQNVQWKPYAGYLFFFLTHQRVISGPLVYFKFKYNQWVGVPNNIQVLPRKKYIYTCMVCFTV